MPTLNSNLRECTARRLGDVATVRLGFTPVKEKRSDYAGIDDRGHAQPFVRRTVLMVQPSNIGDDDAIDWRRLDRINVQPRQSYESHVLRPGMVLLCLRGVMRVATLTKETLQHDLEATADPLPVVASSAWAVINPHAQALAASYLAWYLKQPATTSRLQGQRAGSALQFIPIAAVQDMSLPLPRRDAQDAVVRAAHLIDKVEKLERQRTELLRASLAGSIQSARQTARAAESNRRRSSDH
ncbi:MAG: hypothetical protein RJA05_114 [Planctomycetota bacterium]